MENCIALKSIKYENSAMKNFWITEKWFSPKKTKGGRNQDAACLDALPVQ